MQTENLKKEQIIREVTPIGNGAHVFTPKDWIGEEIVLIRVVKPSLKERVLDILTPYLENIRGVYVYGSYARGEAEKESDIDVLIIANKKFSIKEKGFEIIVLKEEDIIKALEISPVLIYSALAEAKPIMNAELLEKLRKRYKPNTTYFKSYIKETKNMIRINEEILDPYSLILRLRGIYIINQLLKNDVYSHKKFRSWIYKNLPKIELDVILLSYKRTKRNKANLLIKTEDLNKILSFLKGQTERLENELNGKKKKEA